MKKIRRVTAQTRAGNGKVICCPHCPMEFAVNHFSWDAIVCRGCGAEVIKKAWLLAERKPEQRDWK
jgi:ribosomal protein L37AE/L43A